MKKISVCLERAVFEIIAKLEEQLYTNTKVKVFVAGGVSVNYHAGERNTRDLDVFFSHKVLPDWKRLVVTLEDDSIIYADPTYNPDFGLRHPDFEENSMAWEGFSSEKVELRVLSPLDVAVSKVGRYSDIDKSDILALSTYFTVQEFNVRVDEALQYYVGNTSWIRYFVKEVSDEMARHQ